MGTTVAITGTGFSGATDVLPNGTILRISTRSRWPARGTGNSQVQYSAAWASAAVVTVDRIDVGRG